MFLSSIMNDVLLILIISLWINIPFGYVRENSPKFSLKWFFWIHASIPFLVYLRLTLHTTPLLIPLCIILAIVGQVIGSKLRRRQMSRDEKESLQRIFNLKLPTPKNFNESDMIIVLLNMGGPRTNKDVKSFQERLFNDPVLIRFPLSFVFQKFFAWILIALRLKVVEDRYRKIGGGSPIYQSTESQAKALYKELQRRGTNIDVIYSFNYSPPLPEETIIQIKQRGKKSSAEKPVSL